MTNVVVGLSAQPDQVLGAYRKIEEAAKRANKELKSMADIDFPGLEDARDELERINVGLAQMGSKLVRGSTAEAYRAGVRGGAYQGGDIVSVLRGMRSQYPDEAAYQREVQKIVRQAGNLANLGGFAVGGGSGAPSQPGGPGGWGGMMPMARSMLGLVGVGTGLAFAGKKLGDAKNEAVGMSDLRHQIGGIDQDFASFRDAIRKSGHELGVNADETIRLNREFVRLSGAMTGEANSVGSREGIRMARMFGLDPAQGVGMMGRAAWLNVGGSNPKDQARLLAEAMAGSNLGGRQAEAAEAMLRFSERSASVLGDAGNTQGFKGLFAALINSSHAGIRANAENILGGYDNAVRAGGHAGDAGKNFIYNTMAKNGISDPFKMQYALEGGFTGSLGGGRMIGPELIKALRSRYGSGNREMLLSAMSGLFGGSMHHAEGALEAFNKHKDNPSALREKIAKIEADLNAGDPGTKARIEANELEKELTKAMQGLTPAMNDLTKQVVDLARGVNHIASFLPGWDKIKGMAGVAAGGLPGPAGILGKAKGLYDIARESLPMMGTRGMLGDAEFMTSMEAEARRLGIDPAVAKALMWHESRGRANAKSSTGAVGLFQLTKGTAKDMGITDLQRYSPTHNMNAALKYLAQMKGRYGGDMEKALAAYNNGPSNIDNGNYQITLPNGRVQDAGKFAESIMVQVEVIHKDDKGKELKRERKDGGRIAVPSMAGAR